MKKSKVVRVGIFQRVVASYRFGIHKTLQKRDDMDFTICAGGGNKKDFFETNGKGSDFPFVKATSWSFEVPFIKKPITFQPYTTWCVISKKYDVIITVDDFFNISLWVNLVIARIFGCKICLWGQGTLKRYVSVSRVLRGLFIRLAHAMLFYTDGPKREWIERGFDEEKLFVAHNALDTNVSKAIKNRITQEELEQFQCEHGLQGKKVLIFCGRLVENRKRPDILIRAMKKVIKTEPNAYAVLIGDGPGREDLQQMIENMQLSQHVVLTGAIYDEELIARYMLSAKVMVMPAALGLSVQHAFGYNVPIIVGDNMANHGPEIELVIDGVTGLLCRDGDVADFEQAICKVLADDAFCSTLSENAAKLIEEKYNIDNMAKGFFDAVAYCAKQ